MWIVEKGKLQNTGIDRQRVKNDIISLLKGTKKSVSPNREYFFEGKDVCLNNHNNREHIAVYAGPNSTFNWDNNREIYICIIGKDISPKNLFEMDVKLRVCSGNVSGEFDDRCQIIFSILREINEKVRLLIFDIGRNCIIRHQSMGQVWKKDTNRINMSNVITNLEALKKSDDFLVLFDSNAYSNNPDAKGRNVNEIYHR